MPFDNVDTKIIVLVICQVEIPIKKTKQKTTLKWEDLLLPSVESLNVTNFPWYETKCTSFIRLWGGGGGWA